MNTPASKFFDVIVIGAGHAGLSMSYMLSKHGISHVVFERGEIANTWRTQRWDSFALNTPGIWNILPGEDCEDASKEDFLLRDDVCNKLKRYTEKFQLPVYENANIIEVTKDANEKYFNINVEKNKTVEQYQCKQLVVATGALNAAKIPSFGKNLSKDIYQLHVKDYRNPHQLPRGAVLIIGGGQSGCQVAEDIAAASKEVYLSTSRVGRVPRSYRGLDILDWLSNKIPFYHALRSEITDPATFTAATPLVSGTGKAGHTLSLQSLHKQGVTILGRLLNTENDALFFANDAADNIRYGDEVSQKTKELVEEFIAKENFPAQKIETDAADIPDEALYSMPHIPSINCAEANITSVIWTTGFTGDFSWLKLPAFNDTGKPVHENGVSPISGLFFLGFPWLRSRKSGIIFGMQDDTAYLMNQLVKNQK
jgi:putative flavoprotein involved in K+ transport